MRRPFFAVAFSTALLVIAARPAGATAIMYTDRDAFLAATGSTASVTFSESNQCVPVPGLLGCAVDFGHVSVFFDSGTGIGTPMDLGFIPISLLTVFFTFENPTTAFGFDATISPGFPPGFPVPVHLVGTGETVFLPGTSFFGFVSSDGTPFTGFSVSPSGGTVGIDNMVIQVPEVSTRLLLLIGVGLLLIERRVRGLAT